MIRYLVLLLLLSIGLSAQVNHQFDSITVSESEHAIEIQLFYTFHNQFEHELAYAHVSKGHLVLISHDYHTYPFPVSSKFADSTENKNIPPMDSRQLMISIPINKVHMERKYREAYTDKLIFRAQDTFKKIVEYPIPTVFLNSLLVDLSLKSDSG